MVTRHPEDEIGIAYPLPRPGHSDADDARLANQDLAQLGTSELMRETRRLDLLILFDSFPPRYRDWAKQRYREAKAELRRRGRR